MVREFHLPDVGEGVAEGELVSWLVAEGDEVSEDQPVAEVETDKALVEVPSPVDGTVRELHWEEGDVVPVGDLFITYDVAGEESAPATAEDDLEVATSEERVFAPPRVRRLAREEGVDLSTLEGSGPGGRITEPDVQAAAEGDASPEPAATASTETATAAEADTAAEPASEPAGTSEVEPEATDRPTPESADRDRTLAAPATRRIAEEEGVDIDAVPATGQREGEAFVTPEAVMEYAEAQKRAQEADAEAVAAGEVGERDRERREPFRGVRKRIADAMVESKYTAPHVTHHDEVDVTELVAVRDRLADRADEQGIHLTYMPFIMKAVVAALQEFPEMNAVIDDDNEEIVYRDYYNVGVATATDVGLMVPVLEDVDRKGMLQLASEMNELVEKARERSISPEELRGSTFTVTNVGGIGGEYATPILNYPESGILAVGEIKRKPRVVTDEDGTESIEPRSVMTLSLSFDHRLVDGAVGARFTNKVMEYLEHPDLLLLE